MTQWKACEETWRDFWVETIRKSPTGHEFGEEGLVGRKDVWPVHHFRKSSWTSKPGYMRGKRIYIRTKESNGIHSFATEMAVSAGTWGVPPGQAREIKKRLDAVEEVIY
jgi:hypothetical protein